MYKSGFVAVIGRPNVGKSSILNDLIGEKISIISNRPQTTRNKIQMVYTDEKMQAIFLDTPGIQMPKNELGEYMLKVSRSAFEEVDLILFVVDTSLETGRLDSYIIEELKKVSLPIVCVINKTDLVNEEEKAELIDKYKKMNMFDRIVTSSALEGDVGGILEGIYDLLEEGPMYYPDDMITDQPIRNIVAEIIREKSLINLREEIPHGIFVGVDKISTRNEKLTDIIATIFVEQKSHKGMVIGKNGQMLKRIGSEARKDIERLLEKKVNLQLWVKVEKDWRKKKNKVKEFGYE